MSNEAVRPSSGDLIDAVRAMRQEKVKRVAEDKDVDQLDVRLTELAASDGWQDLKSFIESNIDRLKAASKTSLANGDSLETIGIKVLVSELCVEKLEGVIQFVEQRAEYVKKKPAAK